MSSDKSWDPANFNKIPGHKIANKVKKYRERQKHKEMMEVYQAYRDKINRENGIAMKTQEGTERKEHDSHCEYFKLVTLNSYMIWPSCFK